MVFILLSVFYSNNIISSRSFANSFSSFVKPPIPNKTNHIFLPFLFHETFFAFFSKSKRMFIHMGSFQYLHSPNIRFLPSGSIAAMSISVLLSQYLPILENVTGHISSTFIFHIFCLQTSSNLSFITGANFHLKEIRTSPNVKCHLRRSRTSYLFLL